MSLRKYNNKKRRRSQAFPEEENEQEEAVEQESSDVKAAPVEEPPSAEVATHDETDLNGVEETRDDEASSDRPSKEAAVWEVFREEHYEVLEQLPLSLHRAYTLLGELDDQVNRIAGNSNILLQLKKYITMRQTAANSFAHASDVPMDVDEAAHDKLSAPEELASTPASPPQDSPPPISPSKRSKARSRTGVNGHTSKAGRDAQKPTPHPPTPPPPETTRSVIAGLARLSEDVMRAANEKLNVARFACDLIDRYIRDMDREIKEQETSLSLGLRPGTHPATIVLPEVVLPKTARAARIQETPVSDEFESPPPEAPEGEGTPEVVEAAEGMTEAPRRTRRSHGWSRKKSDHKEREKEREMAKEMEKEGMVPAVVPGEEENAPPQPQGAMKLTVTLPPLASLQQPLLQPELPLEAIAAEDEERYCYCNGVSYGSMVGCDGSIWDA
ncbi:hypothetical protein NM688_g5654 [Phlebia brevispora]|uniref:Uncharacterized protein n=1 Tax=Phlebia brevispora TaxID=194682 RepID=A0ACC1SRY2_9APHY|nr:hypothetical protein NM688_g5654 [Phlebia brevispora]